MQRGIVWCQIAGLNVAIAGFRARWLNAQHHNVVTGRGHGNAFLQRLQKARLVANDVVGGKNTKHRIGILPLDQKRGQSAGRRSIARHRLLHNLSGGHALQLVGNLVGQIFVGDDPGFIQRG